MKLEYEDGTVAGYVCVSDENIDRTEDLGHGILVDLNANGDVIGVEIIVKKVTDD